jgi:hypothetical protein
MNTNTKKLAGIMKTAKDLTKVAPSSPRVRVGGYAILARMADKGRALLNGTVGEYHFDCPVDNMLFDFKGVKGAEVKSLLKSGGSDKQIAAWLDSHGSPKTAAEVRAWSDSVEAERPYADAESKDWFVGECAKLGLKPETTTLFDYLEADDRATFKN